MTVVNPGGGGGQSLATLDARYEPQTPATCLPPNVQVSASMAVVANQVKATRVIVPRSGFLRDVSLFVGTTGGNCMLMAYDTGDASPGNRTLLGQSGSVVVVGNNQWQTWDPGAGVLPVTAGQEIDLAFMFDSALPAIGRAPSLFAPAAAQLPANFIVASGGALPKLAWTFAAGAFAAPASIAEASCAATNTPPLMIARVA